MSRPATALALVGAVAVALLACRAGTPGADDDAIPRPDLGRVAVEVRSQIEEAQETLAQALASSPADAAGLAAAWGDLGNTYHAYELVAAARSCYHRACALAPADARWPYFLGQLERELGDRQAAVRELRRTVVLDPTWIPAHVALGETLLADDRADEARDAFAAAIARLPSCAPALAGLGKLALAAGRLEEARDQLGAALAAQPEASSIHHHLARVARLLGQPEAAERHLRLAGPRQPTVPDAWMARIEQRRLGSHNLMTQAQRATRAGRLEQAISLYRRVLDQDPDHVRARVNLGTALARRGQLAEARTELERAVALAPSDPLARFDLGTVLLRLGDPGAVDELTKSLALDPRQPAARFNLATAHRLAGHHEQAREHYRALVELAPTRPTGYYWQALSELRLERAAAARRTLESGLANCPDAPLLASTLARLLATNPDAAVRDGLRALALARRALAADPGWENRRTLAMALAETGAFAAALDEQRRALAQAAGAHLAAADRGILEQELATFAEGRPVRLPWWEPSPQLDRRADDGERSEAAEETP